MSDRILQTGIVMLLTRSRPNLCHESLNSAPRFGVGVRYALRDAAPSSSASIGTTKGTSRG
jgi:hypothetical protein